MKRSIIFMAILVLLGSTLAYAGHGHRGMKGSRFGDGPGFDGFHGFGQLLNMADKIGLDDKQQAKISVLMEKNGTARIDKEAELEKAQLKMKNLRINDAPDSDILAMMDKIGLLKTELQKMRYTHRQEIESILTAEQLDKLEQLRQERHQRRFDGKGRGSGMGRGQGMGGGQGMSPSPGFGQGTPGCPNR